MTDLRFGADLLPAIKRLPSGSGVIFRHYELGPEERLALFRQIRRICRQRGHMLLLAGPEQTARRWHADGVHAQWRRGQSKRIIRSTPVHDKRELTEAKLNKVDMALISPIFATASHPGGQTLGRSSFMALVRQCADIRVIALGGMTARRAATMDKRIIHGWAAIDAFRR